jgi:hypothetical protein
MAQCPFAFSQRVAFAFPRPTAAPPQLCGPMEEEGPVASFRALPSPGGGQAAPGGRRPKDGGLVLVAILGTSACRWRLSHGVAGVRQRLEAACAKRGLQLAGPAGPAQLLGVVVLRSYQFIYETPASHPAKPPGTQVAARTCWRLAFAAVGGRSQ